MRYKAFAALALLAAVSCAASAADKPAAAPRAVPTADENGWIVTLEGNVSLEPDYPGASTTRVQRLPGFGLRRAGTKADFASPDDGLDLSVLDEGWLKAGPVAKIMGGRSIKNNRELTGLRHVNWTLEAGAFVEYWPLPWLRGRAELRDGLNGHRGLVGTLGGDLVATPGAFTLAVGPRLQFGDGRYMRKFFSVSPAEAVANGRVTAFQAHAGAHAMGVTASAAYEFSPAWTGTVWGNYSKLLGDATRSPIPLVLGSRNQASVGASVSYSFGIKGF